MTVRRMWVAGAALLVTLALGGAPAHGQETTPPVQAVAASPPASAASPPASAASPPASEASPPPSFAFRDTFAHPEVLADATWLVSHLHDPSLRIVDARVPFEAALYPTGHIPGAVYLDVLDQLCCASRIMGPEAFADLMGRLGVGDDTTVVVYDTDGGLWAARLWWALRYYGHEDARVFGGGLREWLSMGLALETDPAKVEPAIFTPQVQPGWRATIDEVRAAIDDPDVALVDALPWPVFTGDSPDFGVGHIPTSVSLPVFDTLDGIGRGVIGPDVLSRMLARLGLDPDQRTITYCGGGYAGASDAYVLYLMGFDRVGLYDGSLMEWTSDPANPMETVP